MQEISPLSNTVGSVLDPIISLRRTISLPPHESAVIDLVLGATESREAALAHVEKYQSSRMADRTFELTERLAATEHGARVQVLKLRERTPGRLRGRITRIPGNADNHVRMPSRGQFRQSRRPGLETHACRAAA